MVITAILILVLVTVLLLTVVAATSRRVARHTMPMSVMAMLLVMNIDRPPPALGASENFRRATGTILTREITIQ